MPPARRNQHCRKLFRTKRLAFPGPTLDLIHSAEVDEDQHMQWITLAALAYAVYGALQVQHLRSKRRNPNRLYLTRPQLLPSPWICSPWQALYESQSDRAFVTTMGFDVETFNYILDQGFRKRWERVCIKRQDTT